MSSTDLSELLSFVIKPRSCSWIYSTAHFLHFLPTMSSTVLQTSFLKLNNQNLQNRVSVLFNMKPKWATESINSPANLSGLRDIFPIHSNRIQPQSDSPKHHLATSSFKWLQEVDGSCCENRKASLRPRAITCHWEKCIPPVGKTLIVSLVATAVTVWMEVKDFSPKTFSEIFGCTAWAKLLL